MPTITTANAGTSTTGWVVNSNYGNEYITLQATGVVSGSLTSKVSDLHPQLYFTYIKKKFSLLERVRLDRRIKALEKAFSHAVDAGQEMLGNKILGQISTFARESVMAAKGIKWKISREDLHRYKHRIRGGRISDTEFENYTRVIPKTVLAKKKALQGVFDSWVIYHYYSDTQADVKDMSVDERAKMRDPVLFGRINENNDLYFVADWEDEYCDLSFDEMLEAMDKEYSEVKLKDKPSFEE